jgi:hypothetical protein
MRNTDRDDRKGKALKRLEAFLVEGVESGRATKMTCKDWDKLRQEVKLRIGKCNK